MEVENLLLKESSLPRGHYFHFHVMCSSESPIIPVHAERRMLRLSVGSAERRVCGACVLRPYPSTQTERAKRLIYLSSICKTILWKPDPFITIFEHPLEYLSPLQGAAIFTRLVEEKPSMPQAGF